MDGQHFDDLARLLAGGRSRRGLLQALGGLLGAGALARLTTLGSEAQTCYRPGVVCDNNGNCCGGSCNDGVCGCVANGYCVDQTDCCESYACVPTTLYGPGSHICSYCGAGTTCEDDSVCCDGLTCQSGECAAAPVCALEGEECPEGDECCDGLDCVAGGGTTFCMAPVTCAAEGEACGLIQTSNTVVCCDGLVCGSEGRCEVATAPTCETDGDCVIDAAFSEPAICCGGECRRIECCIEDQDPNARCAEGEACFEGVCDPIVCAAEGSKCTDSQDCCGTLVCVDTICAVVQEVGHGKPGGSDVAQLPSAGVGAEPSALDPLLGAGLAAAAAGALAAARLRSTASAPSSSNGDT